MGGVLTHLLIGLISGGLVWHFSKRLEFGIATLVGNTVVDFLSLVYLL